jgi:hypothetical protein
MKYTMLYLKYIVVVVLLIITVVMLILGVLCVGLGIFGTAQECNPGFLVFLPVGLFCGFSGFVALDCFKCLMDKWELKDI